MRRRGAIRRGFLAGLGLFALAGGFSVWRQMEYVRNMRPYRPYLSISLFPGARQTEMVRTLSLGYDHMASVFLWLRTIQDFGGQFRDPFALRSLSSAFWGIVTLDPHFTEAYDFGGLVLGDEGGDLGRWLERVHPDGTHGGWPMLRTEAEAYASAEWMVEETLRLHEYGIEHDPDHYRSAYNAAYTCLMTLREPERAIPYAEVATLKSDCPDWVQGTIPYLRGRSGEFRVALSLWFSQLRDAIRNGDELGISIRTSKIAEDGVNAWNSRILTDAMNLWAAFHGGALPESVEQIGRDGFLAYSTEDILASIAAWREAHGTVDMPPGLTTLAREGFFPLDPAHPPERLRFFDFARYAEDVQTLIETATPFARITEQELGLEKYLTVENRLPDCPLNLHYLMSGNRTGIDRIALLGGIGYVIDRVDRQVRDTNRLFEDTARDLVAIVNRLREHRVASGAYPATIDELFSPGLAPLERGTGQPFAYDPATGIVRSVYFPQPELVIDPMEGVDPFLMGQPRPLDERPRPATASPETSRQS